MASYGRIAGHSFDMTDEVFELMNKMHVLDPMSAPIVQPAILAPFWAVGDFVNFSAPSGCGKSTFAADVILGAVLPHREGAAIGGLFRFNLHELHCGPIAIIDGEGDIARWNSIMRRKTEADGANWKSAVRNVLYMRPSELGLHNRSTWESASVQLVRSLKADCVRFVVIDTLPRMWGAEDINSTDWVQRGLVPFRSECQECGISALLLSHTKRRQRANDPAPTGPIGTSFQEGQVDGQIIMNRIQGGFSMVHQKSRRSFWIQQGSKVTVRFSKGCGYEPREGWQAVWPHECPDFDAIDIEIDSSIRAKVVEVLAGDPSKQWSSADLADEVGCTSRTISTYLRELEKAGHARHTGSGPSTRWKAAP